jgi:hypothetical protein
MRESMLLLLLLGSGYVGSQACAPCHAEIVRRFRETPMARSSGLSGPEVPSGVVTHAPSSMSYRILVERGFPALHYTGKGDVRPSGSQPLPAYIGSGAVGRSYLFRIEGWWFLAPVSYYSQRDAWGIAPGYEQDRRMHFSRRVTENCLFCHATGAHAAAASYNRFADPPWQEPGIGCERCHSPGEAHVKNMGPISNPVKLDPGRRDDVCAQCHLSGEERIERPGMTLTAFRPGERLADCADFFVMAGAGMRATSHVERLAASRCKQRAGERLWCGTCHDPHALPAPQERVSYFRANCLSCHEVQVCRRGEDCAGCHLPKTVATDAGHSVLTDHSIPRRAAAVPQNSTSELVPLGKSHASARSWVWPTPILQCGPERVNTWNARSPCSSEPIPKTLPYSPNWLAGKSFKDGWTRRWRGMKRLSGRIHRPSWPQSTSAASWPVAAT